MAKKPAAGAWRSWDRREEVRRRTADRETEQEFKRYR